MSSLDGGKEESLMKTFRIFSIVFTVAFVTISAVLFALHSYGAARLMLVLAGGFFIATVRAFISKNCTKKLK